MSSLHVTGKMKDCFALHKTCPSHWTEWISCPFGRSCLPLIFTLMRKCRKSLDKRHGNQKPWLCWPCHTEQTQQNLVWLGANTRNQRERYQWPKIRRLSVRNELNSTQGSETLGAFCWLLFLSDNRFGLFVLGGNQLHELWKIFTYISREISVYSVLCQVYGNFPGTIRQSYIFRTWLIENFPRSYTGVTHTQQKDPLARTGIALCWHKLIHFHPKKQVNFHLGKEFAEQEELSGCKLLRYCLKWSHFWEQAPRLWQHWVAL